jgi:predicted nucleotidyltransferase
MQWIPPWLASTYAKLVSGFGGSIFTTKSAAELVGLESKKLNIAASRLASSGWLVRARKGEYLALDPLAVMTALESDWTARLKEYPDALALVQVALSELIRSHGSGLVSVAAFGSLGRKEWNATSDVDLLVVADGLPERYSDRLESVRRVAEACSRIRVAQWTRTGREFHLLDLVLLRRDELEDGSNRLFLLDLTRDAIMLYDKKGFLSKKLAQLGRDLEAAGAMRVSTPTGRSYWDLRAR